jgi:hypothetical protein
LAGHHSERYGSEIMAVGEQGTGFRNQRLPVFEAGNVVVNRNGIFMYSSLPPAKGNMVMAFAPVSGGSDSVGNVYPHGFNWGIWNASGALTSHFGVDNEGSLYLANNAGNIVMFVHSMDGRFTFSNVFGATIFIIAPQIGALFFYQDLGSASQGLAVGCMNWNTSNVTDPVGGLVFGPGLTSSDPVFGDYSRTAGANIILAQLAHTLLGQIVAAGGSTSPAYQIDAPEQGGTAPDHPQILMLGNTNTRVSQVIIGKQAGTHNALVPVSARLVEIQKDLRVAGPIELASTALPPSVSTAAIPYADGASNLKFIGGGDGINYATGSFRAVAASQQVSTAAFTEIDGFGVGVGGETYIVDCYISGFKNTSAGTAVIAFSGPAINFANLSIEVMDATTGAFLTNATLGSLTSFATPSIGNGDTFSIKITGSISFSAAGFFQVQMINGSAATWHTFAGSYFSLKPV